MESRSQATGVAPGASAEHTLRNRKFVTALARGLEVMRAFRARDGFLTNQEIAARTDLPRPTVSRLVYTLCELGYLHHNARLGAYQLAPAAITLGYVALTNMGVRHVARPYMDEAAEALAGPVGLGVADGDKALYVDISRGSTSFTVQLGIGSRIPLAITAMGRALLAAMDEAERTDAVARACARHPDHEARIRDGMTQALEDYEAHGFVVSSGEWRDDIHSVGVPLVAGDGTGIYAFNCGGPPHQFSTDRLYSQIGPAIAALARVVDDALAGRPAARPGGGWLEAAMTAPPRAADRGAACAGPAR